MRKQARSPAISDAPSTIVPSYITWQGDISSQPDVVEHINAAVQEYRGVPSVARASHYSYNQYGGCSYSPYSHYGVHHDYSNLATNVSGRPGLSRQDYEAFRPHEAIPTHPKAIMAASDQIYQRIGLIRNVIDLMGDFGSQGIRLSHPNKQIQKFYRKWFERVNGTERSERFLNQLYRLANVVVRIQTAKLSKADKRKFDKVIAEPDMKMQKLGVKKGEIPIKYTFLHPATVDVVGGDLSSFVGHPQYFLTIPKHICRMISAASKSKDTALRKLVEALPPEILQSALTANAVPLPQDKTRVFHYKKDDWQDWAKTMIYAIMADINILEKMKLADTAALDGAISNLRIIKLGSLEHKIAPTRAAASRLAEILESNVGGGTMDIVWGPDIELIESKSEVYKFLGEEKYKPHLDNIYAGLGIPPTLTGTFGSTGTTNNFISLKTILQRLEYGRNRLNEFWIFEIEKVQKAMGFRFPAKIEYDIDNLGDENAERALLIQMADRNLISDELLQKRFGHDPELERVRLNRESRERDSGSLVLKSGPWHDPQIGITMKKAALQGGTLTPGEVGLKKEAKRRDMQIFDPNNSDQGLVDQRDGKNEEPQAQVPGRPKNAKDKQKRKTKDFKPQVRASLDIWLTEAHKAIAKIINPLYLEQKQKKNMRYLTAHEMEEIEQLRFGVLLQLEPLQKITPLIVGKQLSDLSFDKKLYNYYNMCINNMSSSLGRKLVLAERQQLQSEIYINNLQGEFDG